MSPIVGPNSKGLTATRGFVLAVEKRVAGPYGLFSCVSLKRNEGLRFDRTLPNGHVFLGTNSTVFPYREDLITARFRFRLPLIYLNGRLLLRIRGSLNVDTV